MAEFDNQEVNRLKHWWDSNGMALVIGAVVGLAVIIGWQGWGWYQDRQANQAADIHQQLQQGLANGNVNDAVLKTADRLKSDYAGTPYAADAALRLAGYYVEQQDYAKAREQLDWAVNNAANEGVAHIARVRAARLAWTQDNADEALQMLDTEHPPAFNALYAEVRGDILAARGDREGAYKAYQLALESLPQDTPSRALETKLADNAPADAADAPSDQKSASAS
jgi:predicted negative regulator of RcsB-dependent stress response